MTKGQEKADALARQVADTLYAREGVGADLGMEIVEARLDYAAVAMEVRPSMLNGHATIHGGMVFTLADTAFAYACNSANVATVAQQASIAFLSPAHAGERIVAEARRLAEVGRSGVTEVVVRGADGRTIAVFQGLSRSLGKPVIEEQD